ncbi:MULTISPECIES: phosphopantetheine-binding protein [unclassified Streptomyces]|uniref:acyl carrier protein n=1 Tax=unclassified Streptomyces TaxID=2593676 RepID=UPI0030147FEA
MSDATQPTFEQIAEIIVEKFDVPRDRIVSDAVLEDIELDSLALIEVALAVKKQFGFDVPTEDLKTSGTVADLYDAVTTAFRAS